MKRLYCRDNLSLIVLATIIGLACGSLLGVVVFVVYPSIDSSWQQISNPPDEAIEILGYYYLGETVYVRTATGKIYACSSPSYKENKGCTELTEVPPELNINVSCNWKVFPTPKPPGKTIHQFEAHPCIPDSTLQVNHIILEDGSIWKWEKGTSEFGDFFTVIFVGVCGIAGAALGLISGIITLSLKQGKIDAPN